jgi:hypothetical protein
MQPEETNVVRMPPHVDVDTPGSLHEDLRAVIRKYSGSMALVTVLGVFRVIENELINEHQS